MGYFNLLPGKADDFFLTVMNSPDEKKLELIRESITETRRDLFVDSSKIKPLIKPILETPESHRFLKELPDLIESASENATLTAVLEEINIKEIYRYEMIWQSTDWMLSSLQVAPDVQIMRNIATNYFDVFKNAAKIAANIERLQPYLAGRDLESLGVLVNRIRDLPVSHRWEMEYAFDAAITINPGGWGIVPSWEGIYSDYAQKILLLYGYEKSIDKVMEIAERELYACDYMKNTHWGIPDRTLDTLMTVTVDLDDNERKALTERIITLYRGIYEWNRDNATN